MPTVDTNTNLEVDNSKMVESEDQAAKSESSMEIINVSWCFLFC